MALKQGHKTDEVATNDIIKDGLNTDKDTVDYCVWNSD